RVRRKALIWPAERDALHDDLVGGDPGMFAHHGRLHDPLAVDDGAKPARPCRVDERGGHRAAVEGGIVAGGEHAIIGDDHAHRRVELAKAAHHPVLPALLVVARDFHGAEQLLGDADLAFAMHARERLADAKLARVRYARQVTLGVAAADAIERFAGDDVEIPRL